MKKLLNFLSSKNQQMWAAIQCSTRLPVDSLPVFRIFAGFFILFFNFPYFLWVGEVPQLFFEPPVLSVANLATGFPGYGVMLTLNIVMILLAVFIILGIKTRTSSVIYILLLLIGSSFHYSVGKVDHSLLFQMELLFCMCFSNWGSSLAIWPDRKRAQAKSYQAISLLAVLLCFGFFTAGFEKAIAWINFDFSKNGTGAWYYKELRLRNYLLAPYFPRLPFWSLKIMDFAAVTFELIPFFLLLKSAKFWRLWLVLACVFHILNAVLLNINFIPVTIIYLAFLDYSRLYLICQRFLKTSYGKIIIVILIGATVTLRLYYLLKGIPASNIFVPNRFIEQSLYFSLVLSCLVLSALIYSVKNQEIENATNET